MVACVGTCSGKGHDDGADLQRRDMAYVDVPWENVWGHAWSKAHNSGTDLQRRDVAYVDVPMGARVGASLEQITRFWRIDGDRGNVAYVDVPMGACLEQRTR